MLSKNQSAFIRALHQKKGRDVHHSFIAEGAKLVNEIVGSGIRIRQIYSSTNFQLDIFNHEIEVIRISERELKRISALVTPNEVLAVCDIPDHPLEVASLTDKLTLILDDIRDPGNLGTIMRIADWFGITEIICSLETVDLYNPKVVQATMGSIARVKLHYRNLEELFATLPAELQVFGAFMEGENLFTATLPSAAMIVVGNESRGVSNEIERFISKKLTIPSFLHAGSGKAGAESLNAAVATAIFCAEFRRR